ncbi:MAG: flagellar basal-body MS-ring/collar protein FliF [Phycisphaerae bacterium]
MPTIKNITEIWQRTPPLQRVILIGVAIGMLVGGYFLFSYATKPEMEMLASGMGREEAAKIVDILSEDGVAYELKEQGTTIYVEKGNKSRLLLSLTEQGALRGDQPGYKILDEEKLGASPFSQRVGLKRAIEGELARSIQTIEGVEAARVHLVQPKGSLFGAKNREASAAVVVKTRPGWRLPQGKVAAIAQLVAMGGGTGLQSQNVAVVDDKGNLLSGENDDEFAKGASTYLDYKARVEEYYVSKIEDMLAGVLGSGKAVARVDAQIDTVASESTTETYDPNGKAVSRETIRSKSSTGTGKGGNANPGGVTKEEDIEMSYQVSRTVERKVSRPGEIRSISVSAFVDLTPPKSDEQAADGAAPAAPAIKVADIQDAIRNAVGKVPVSDLKVIDAPMQQPEMTPVVAGEPGFGPDFLLDALGKSSIGLLVIGALLALRIVRGKKPKPSESNAAMLALQGEGQAGADRMLPNAGHSGDDPDLLRSSIASALQENPEEVKRLFLSWVDNERGE